MEMVCFINGRFLSQKITGVQRYALELLYAWDRLLETGDKNFPYIKPTILAPSDARTDVLFNNINIKRVGKLKGHLWEQLELPLFSGSKFLLNLCNTAPVVKRNQFITIHDASIYSTPATYSYLFKTWYKLIYNIAGRVSKRVITVSNFSKSELIKYCKLNPDRISVTYLSGEHFKSISAEDLTNNALNSTSYIFAVSSMNPNKNFTAILKALEKLEEKVNVRAVIAGGVNPKVFKGTSDLKVSDSIEHLGYVTDGQLKTLFQNALCFIFPSYYEGFGLPPLEAMECGCPVIVSDRASLPEICGDSVLYFNPDKPEEIANHILRLVEDEKLVEKYRDKGKLHASQYTWKLCAIQTLKLLEESLTE
ncbi:group 1 glycosyl transferase [Cohnella xylanilytica]|uniref:glycosyltransferase family 4 protein n=1 Tax=Cohnella xylanilytica TaxID=557555 RepID=UPI001B169A06|nr:glycosyltransferase family 1 protein [Cohnella xylanilytica]GIO12255.1 group 1 glycosyl transferase [Cohnella xylanilytica]